MIRKIPLFRLLNYVVPPFIWMFCIFLMSAHKSISVTRTYWYDFAIFKSLHMMEYAFLFFLWYRCITGIFKKNTKLMKNSVLYGAFCTILYAMFDEYHQLFVPTRTGQIKDVFIDAIGVVLMIFFLKKYGKLVEIFL